MRYRTAAIDKGLGKRGKVSSGVKVRYGHIIRTEERWTTTRKEKEQQKEGEKNKTQNSGDDSTTQETQGTGRRIIERMKGRASCVWKTLCQACECDVAYSVLTPAVIV